MDTSKIIAELEEYALELRNKIRKYEVREGDYSWTELRDYSLKKTQLAKIEEVCHILAFLNW